MTYHPPTTRAERAANILQARMAWSDAERYAALLDQAGLLESGDEQAAVAVLIDHMPERRATALISDLRMYGAMEKQA